MTINQNPKVIVFITVSVVIITLILFLFFFYSNETHGISNTHVSINDEQNSTIKIPKIRAESNPLEDTVRNIAPQAQVIQSSPTQSGYDVENVLSDHPDSTGVIFTGPPSYTFTLGLGYATKITRIEIQWENNSSIADEYRIDDVDFSGRIFKKIIQKKNVSGDHHIIYIPDNQKSSFLKFTFMNITSPESSKIIQVSIFADEPDEFQTILMNSSNYNKLFLSKNDPDNPLNVFRDPIRYSMVELADRILAEESNLTDHQKIVKLMQLTYDYKIGTASNNDPETIVKEEIGACGGFANVLLALTATQHIPGRMIGLYNYPPNDGHVVVEFFYEGSWHVYDPTYGSYFVNTTSNTSISNVLSLEDLKHAKNLTTDLKHVIQNEIRYNKQYPYSTGYADLTIYQKAEPSGQIGPEFPFFWPLNLDLKNKSSLNLEIEKGTDPKNQGSLYIGAASTNNNQIWTLTSLEPRQDYGFILTPYLIGGDLPSGFFNTSAQILKGGLTQNISSMEHTFKKSKLEPWEIEFIAEDSTVQIQITHPYNGSIFHYISIKKYEILTGNALH